MPVGLPQRHSRRKGTLSAERVSQSGRPGVLVGCREGVAVGCEVPSAGGLLANPRSLSRARCNRGLPWAGPLGFRAASCQAGRNAECGARPQAGRIGFRLGRVGRAMVQDVRGPGAIPEVARRMRRAQRLAPESETGRLGSQAKEVQSPGNAAAAPQEVARGPGFSVQLSRARRQGQGEIASGFRNGVRADWGQPAVDRRWGLHAEMNLHSLIFACCPNRPQIQC